MSGSFIAEVGPEICGICHRPKSNDCVAAEFYADPVNLMPVGPGRGRCGGRIRIEMVADMLEREARIDYEADMAYIRVRPTPEGGVYRTDVKLEDRSLITDYTEDGELIGIEIFMVQAAIRYETVAALKRLLSEGTPREPAIWSHT